MDPFLAANGQFAIRLDRPITAPVTLVLHFSYTMYQKDPVYARQAFPCFDEPWMKATFQLTLLTDPSVPMALYNMPLLHGSGKLDASTGLREWRFGTSPVMSSYLVAFALGNLTGISTSAPASDSNHWHETNITVWTTPDRIANYQWALHSAAAILPKFEQLFGYPYFLPKLDILALPNYAFLAMENWGLLVYDQKRIEITPDESPDSARSFPVADTVAHEMAHLWCGDLEACATVFEYFGAGYASAALQGVGTFFYATADVLPFGDDFAGGTQHPISDPTNADAASDMEVQALFDDIEYQKGGSVLRMLWNYMSSSHYDSARLPANVQPGHDVFEDNMTLADIQHDPFIECYQAWIQEKQFFSATGADFIASFSNTSGGPIDLWMHNWIYSAGYPLVIVEVDADGNVTVQQAPFDLQGLPWQCDPTTAWWIPVSFRSNTDAELQWTTINDCTPVPLGQLEGSKGEFLKINVNQSGYYRVQYPDIMWQMNTQAVASADSPLSQSDVAGLLDDSYALHQIEGAINISVWLELVRALGTRGKLEYSPWAILDSQLPAVAYYLQGRCGAAVSSFLRSDVTVAFSELPLNCSTLNGANDRAAAEPILDIAAISMNEGLTSSAVTIVNAAADGGPPLDPDLADAIRKLAVASGDANVFHDIFAEFTAAPNDMKPTYSPILAYSPDVSQLNATLYQTLSTEFRLEDLQDLASAIALQRLQGRDLAWQFFTR
ncbi:hypothetical protein CVIRNUC_010417 [Coccomyxa viridis]|uniref:Alpha-aminoacylpeptide hydrolase n=1 Tax=Coccomyxa viridis TaxID=1274662 RepID=A0AAV1IIP3_9CHLO|nr:hypothetical protein CVIRNUC_010417 [Coccomyxa viridis]